MVQRAPRLTFIQQQSPPHTQENRDKIQDTTVHAFPSCPIVFGSGLHHILRRNPGVFLNLTTPTFPSSGKTEQAFTSIQNDVPSDKPS